MDKLQNLRDEIVKAGGRVTSKGFLKGEELAKQRAQINLIQAKKAENPRGYALGQFINNALSAISVVFVLFVVLFGVLVVPGFVIVAEAAVVYEGIKVVTPVNAGLYSAALLLLYFVLLFIEQIIIHSTKRERDRRYSLQNLSGWWKYFRGKNAKWPGQFLDPLMSGIRQSIFWIAVTIVLFGLLGRVADKMLTLQGNWIAGLVEILRDSSLSDFMEYLSSVALAAGFLTGVHFIVYFVYGEYKKLTGGISTQDFFAGLSLSELENQEIERYYLEVLQQLRSKKSLSSLEKSAVNRADSYQAEYHVKPNDQLITKPRSQNG